MEWTDLETLARTLGISRATFYRKVQGGQIEATEVAGRRIYRAVIEAPGKSQSRSVSRDETRPIETTSRPGETASETDRTAVLALVERYETRIDALLTERREVDRARIEAERAATEARERAAALAAEVERARLELEHARKLAELEIGNLEALARAKLADAERIAREERQRREGAEAQLAAARALESLPWWRFGQRRQVRALLAN